MSAIYFTMLTQDPKSHILCVPVSNAHVLVDNPDTICGLSVLISTPPGLGKVPDWAPFFMEKSNIYPPVNAGISSYLQYFCSHR